MNIFTYTHPWLSEGNDTKDERKGLGLFYDYKVTTLPIQIYYLLKCRQKERVAKNRENGALK